MSILLIIFGIIVSLIALVLIIALFVKKEYVIEREVTVNAPRSAVFDFIRLLKNQERYSKWVMMDPSSRKTYVGTDGTAGFVTTWDSDNSKVGKGSQEIKNIEDNVRIDIEVRFEKPFEGVGIVHLLTDSISPNETRVRWGMHGASKYPMNIANLFIPELLGKDLQESLENLKRLLEK
jgi:hypothetical protein